MKTLFPLRALIILWIILTELKLANEARLAGKNADARKWFALAKESFRICYQEFPNQVKEEIGRYKESVAYCVTKTGGMVHNAVMGIEIEYCEQ